MGIILEKMFSFFEWLYIADSVPGLVWLILGAAVVVLGVVALNGLNWKSEKLIGFPVHLCISLMFMVLMYYVTFSTDKQEYGYHMYTIVKDDVPFVLSDISTWAFGLKWSFFHFLLVVGANLYVALKKDSKGLLPCVLLTVPLTLIVFRLALVVKGIFLIGGVAFIAFETAIILLSVAGWVITAAGTGELKGNVVTTSAVPAQPAGGGVQHADDFGVLRMPEVIKDEYGNTYTRQYVDFGGTYAEYAGNYTVVTIYSENVKMFSATADGHYFSW